MTSPTPSSEPTASSPAPATTTPPTASEQPSSRWGFVITVVCDIVLPVGLYYVLRAAGTSEITALLLSGSAPALHTLHSAIRHRKLDSIGVFTVALLVVSALASLLTSDPRIALARNGLFTALAGVWLLITLFTARPFTYQALRTLLPGRAAKLEQLWESDASFRRVWRGLTTLWAVGLLCDALLRLIMAYTLPIDTVPALDGVLYAVSWIVLQVITQIVLFRSHTLTKIFGERRPGRRLFASAARQQEAGD
ncbi:VC0807 family protein [Streptomyces hirsutus]|uniref:VC0807 family protein n=1 Tax=Streptomyces hirsutus TaxID=35620 RepID=UPI0006E35C43|nr:VC0807 family protein [Streptomyces hirsutus]